MQMQYCGICNQELPLGCNCECKDRWVKVGDYWVIGAPQWLKNQMESLKKLPPSTLDEVVAQWKASEEQLRYEGVEDIRKAKVIR